ncbi:conserved Plasmodium protein, unknown function [Plasmodium vinckei vinckei]|uniref:Uncharacterized protein n=1 Tax=Plasmodium vinckei vinckei TaxID=54757 RepID=A0A449BYC4_PLAVN|nr:conserved Plasmodium protein, unknown function [Plasmodium vinckei vinckei]KEG04711.1 hypothetical protein YYE_00286 [Plasmodium vinckei vinckei]VEV58362.1 conserved Plasmodium protein, unknown function [Plasmodium vinckei vinckei]
MKLINTKINENANIVIECFHKCLCGNRNTNSFSSYNSLICKKNKRNFSLLCNKKHNQNKEQNENIIKKLPAIYKDEIKSVIDNGHTNCCEQIKKGITSELSVNNPSELDKVKLFKENLKRYNLFNIYLEKIKAPLTKKEKERQRKIININSVKYFDDYISIFNIDSLLIYANHNFEELKRKGWKGNRKEKDAYQRVVVEYNEIKHTHISNENNIVTFFKIFIQFNKILKDFFYQKNEERFNEIFVTTFEPFLHCKFLDKIETNENKESYDENFHFKIIQLIKIFNHINFFSKLKGININYLQNSLNISRINGGEANIYRNSEKDVYNSVDENKLFYEYMSIDQNDENNNFLKSDANFIDNLNLFGKKLNELQQSINHFSSPQKKYSPSLDVQTKKCSHNSTYTNYSNIYNKGIFNSTHSDDIICKKENYNVTNDRLNWYITLVKGFSLTLKKLIKYLNDDCLVRLFAHCIHLFDKNCNVKEVFLFYKEMYNKIKQMNNISNKNLVYILNACNYYLKEENVDLLKYLQNEILLNNSNVQNYNCNTSHKGSNCDVNKNNKRPKIYSIPPSHIENILYTFSKYNFKDKKLFLLFSEIIREKCNGFSCITTINILNSFTRLHFEKLIFYCTYEKIKEFDFITFMMCKGTNIIKLIKTLLKIEYRNVGGYKYSLLMNISHNISGENCKSNNAAQNNPSCIIPNDVERQIHQGNKMLVTDKITYVKLIIALIYELKMHITNESNSYEDEICEHYKARVSDCNINDDNIRNIYKKILRLQIFYVKNQNDLVFLKNILKKNYTQFDINKLNKFFVFSFINSNIDKINFHKLIFTLLAYNNFIGKNKLKKYTEKKKKFI